MQDTALYQYLLGLQSPWTVSRVNLDVNAQRVDVWAAHPADAAWACPHCSIVLPCTIMPRSERGGIWTVASSKPTCMRASHG